MALTNFVLRWMCLKPTFSAATNSEKWKEITIRLVQDRFKLLMLATNIELEASSWYDKSISLNLHVFYLGSKLFIQLSQLLERDMALVKDLVLDGVLNIGPLLGSQNRLSLFLLSPK